MAHAGVGQITDDALARDQAAALARPSQPHYRRRHRPHAARPADHGYLPADLRDRTGARGQHAAAPRTAPHEQRPHGHDDHPEVRGGAQRPRGAARPPQRRRQRGGDGRRGAPHAVRPPRRKDARSHAAGYLRGLHRHAHRQGLPANHAGRLRQPDRLVHDPAVGRGRRHRAHLLRGALARTTRRGTSNARPSLRERSSPTSRRRRAPRSAAATPARNASQKRPGASRRSPSTLPSTSRRRSSRTASRPRWWCRAAPPPCATRST